MGYVQDTLSGNEEVAYQAKFHWLYTFVAFLNLILLGVREKEERFQKSSESLLF